MQVIDSSVVVALLLNTGPDGRWAARTVASSPIAAPALMAFEVANLIRRSTVRGAIDPSTGSAALDDLLNLPAITIPFEVIARRAWELRENVTTYDAAYVATAELLGCRLVTLDRRLARASGPTCEIITSPIDD